MESLILKSPFLPPPIKRKPNAKSPKKKAKTPITAKSSVHSDPWSLSGGNILKPKPKSKHQKNPLSDDNARRIIKAKARYLSALRKNQGPHAQTPKWIKRTPEQMVQYLEDDRNGHLYGRHVVAAIKVLRGMAGKREEERDVRMAMSGFVGKLSFKEMCVVLKEQRGWREARDFFAWMKLQLSYRPSVIVYTIVLRIYGQVGKIKLAEQTFLELLEAGCEPDEIACGTMLCTYARWGRHRAMLSFYSAIEERRIILSVPVYNFMLSSLQKKLLHGRVIELWKQMVDKGVMPNSFTYTVVIGSLVKQGLCEEALKTFNEMRNIGHLPEEATYSLLISASLKSDDHDVALRLYEDMRSRGIVPSNFTCASLLTLYYKNEDYSKALSLFTEMQSKRIAADEVIYGLLIRIYGKLGLYEDAQKTFEETEHLGLLSDEKTYLAMAQVHLSFQNSEKALNVINLMKSRNIWLSRFAYIVLLQCYVMKGELVSAEETFQTLSNSGHPDAGSCNDMLNLYVKLNLIEKAKDFIVQIRNNKVDFDEQLYKTVIKVLCKEGMLKDFDQLIEEMRTNNCFKDSRYFHTIVKVMCRDNKQCENFMVSIEPDPVALGLLLGLFLAVGNFIKAEEILRLLVGTGLSIVNQLVGKFIREGDICRARRVNDQVTNLGCRLDSEIIASLIALCGQKGELRQAQEIFAAVADAPVSEKSVFTAMIDAYVKCGKSEEAYSLYKDFSETVHDLGAVGIGMVVNALTNSGKHQEAENISHKCIQENMKLDTVAYNIFIKAMLEAGLITAIFCSFRMSFKETSCQLQAYIAGRLHFAARIYQHMHLLGVPPSIQTFNTMISVYGRAQKLDKAVEMFNTACNLGLSLDEKAYMNMVSCYGKAGKRREASLLFTKMQEDGIKPGVVSYNIMMNVYAVAGLYNEVEELFKAMHKDGYSADSFSYLTLVRAYTRSLKYSEAEETIIAMKKKGIPPSCAHFNHLLSAYANAGLIEEAERVYKEQFICGLIPNLACFRTMLKGYMDYGYVHEGIKFFEQIRESAETDRFIMSGGVHLYNAAGKRQEAEVLLESMNHLRIPFLNKLEVGSKAEYLMRNRSN